MVNTNSFSGIVKLLETPKVYFINQRIRLTWVRVELPQKRKSNLVTLLIWGNIGRQVKKFYKANDYILIEGYSSIRSKKIIPSKKKGFKQLFITVLRVYPFLLNAPRPSMK